jgi:hypothetical protein
VIVQARKPEFFNYNMSLYEVVTADGLMRPVLAAKRGGLYCGGSAGVVEKALGVEGDDLLYVGDHIYTDAALAKINFRWVGKVMQANFDATIGEAEAMLEPNMAEFPKMEVLLQCAMHISSRS